MISLDAEISSRVPVGAHCPAPQKNFSLTVPRRRMLVKRFFVFFHRASLRAPARLGTMNREA
jgi:hypothetical protein